MKRILNSTGLALAVAMLVWFMAGCDSPNGPDAAKEPYHLVHAYSFDGSVEDVCACGDLVAVAKGSFGADLYRNTGADTLTRILTRVVTPGTFCKGVGLDTVNSLLAVFTYPTDNNHYLFNYLDPGRDSFQTYLNLPFSNYVWDFGVWSRPDTVAFWGADYQSSTHTLYTDVYEKTTDTTEWLQAASCPNLNPATPPRGFTIREADGTVFVGIEDLGVLIYDVGSCAVTDTIDTPGLAYDCALSGNTLVIADEYSVQIAQLTDPLHGEIISSLTVGSSSTSRAHRLRHVTIDGNYACVSDDVEGVFIIDISNPASPTAIQLLPMHDVNEVASDGHGDLYVACSEQGFLHYRR
jgi:hypothetical protein